MNYLFLNFWYLKLINTVDLSELPSLIKYRKWTYINPAGSNLLKATAYQFNLRFS